MTQKIPPATKILVVDDEKHMRMLVLRMLSGLGVTKCTEAQDGVQALSLLCADGACYDLVLLDIDMAGMNGFQTLETIRSAMTEKVRNIPVVMLTGHSDAGAVKECVPLKIHGWIVKPASIANLEKHVLKALTNVPVRIGKT